MSHLATPTEDVFDARELPCETKRPALIARCVQLPRGRSFIFVNGHDPVPVRRFLDQQFPGCFRWDLLASADPAAIRLQVTKLGEPAGGFPAAGVDFSCR
jgi:uncharacterized protein (DUF2249 family)